MCRLWHHPRSSCLSGAHYLLLTTRSVFPFIPMHPPTDAVPQCHPLVSHPCPSRPLIDLHGPFPPRTVLLSTAAPPLAVPLQRPRQLQRPNGPCIDARKRAPRCVLAISACTRWATTNERTQQRPHFGQCAMANSVLGGAPACDVRRPVVGSKVPRHGESQRRSHRVCRHAWARHLEKITHHSPLRRPPRPAHDLAPASANRNLHPRTPALTPQPPSPSDPPPRRRRRAAPRRTLFWTGHDKRPIDGDEGAYVPAKRSECGAQQTKRRADHAWRRSARGALLHASTEQSTYTAFAAAPVVTRRHHDPRARLGYRKRRMRRHESAGAHSAVHRVHDPHLPHSHSSYTPASTTRHAVASVSAPCRVSRQPDAGRVSTPRDECWALENALGTPRLHSSPMAHDVSSCGRRAPRAARTS